MKNDLLAVDGNGFPYYYAHVFVLFSESQYQVG